MTVKSLMSMLESFADDSEIAIEITKENGQTIVTYDIGFGHSESGEFMLQIHGYAPKNIAIDKLIPIVKGNLFFVCLS